jgi:cytochrome c biogenesis protein CcdA
MCELLKHHFERPRRVIKLFFMDGTKQLLSNGMLHILNVWVSVAVGHGVKHDRCGGYFMSIVIDVSFGLLLTYTLVVLSNKLLSATFTRVQTLTQRMKSGNYFRSVKKDGNVLYVIDYAWWIKQFLI